MRVRLFGVLVVAMSLLGVPVIFAYEMHAVNVVARMENPLVVDPSYIDFDLSKEGLKGTFTVSLSNSFEAQERLGSVNYQIEFELKPLDGPTDTSATRSFLTCTRDPEETLEPLDEVETASLNEETKDTSDNWAIYASDSSGEGREFYEASPHEVETASLTHEAETASLNEGTKDTSDNWAIYASDSSGAGGEFYEASASTGKKYRVHITVEIVSYGRLAKRAEEL